MTREDLIKVRDKIASKLDEESRAELICLYDIVASPDCGGMTNDEMKRLLNNKTLDEISWSEYLYIRKQAKSPKNVVIADKSGAYYVVLDCKLDGAVKAIYETGEMCWLKEYRVVSGIQHENFMSAVAEMYSYVVDRNRQALRD